MSAELYDAEMAGALARPAIDVLPTNTRKGKAEELPSPVLAQPAADAAPEAPSFETATEPEVPEAFAAPSDPAAPVEIPAVESPAPRKVFGMALTRSRKPKAADAADAPEAQDESADVVVEDLAPEDVPQIDEAPAFAADPFEASQTEVVAASEHVAVAPSMPDHTEEVRAMRALLEASEQVRQAAEARTAAAEAQLRTVTNTVQEWQIRHREAESTITELAASLAGSETRMAELHQQLSAALAERDELTSQLDAATSPATS